MGSSQSAEKRVVYDAEFFQTSRIKNYVPGPARYYVVTSDAAPGGTRANQYEKLVGRYLVRREERSTL